jgi:hypothetical protein
MKFLLLVSSAFMLALPAAAQKIPQRAADPFQPISFLIGAWEARTINNPSVTAVGAYNFQAELNGHVVTRHSIADTAKCKGPADLNCEHSDMLYIYADAPGQPLHAIYFDNEGHVIHYTVTALTPTSAEFLSNPQQPGPQFRLIYELKGTVMSGKFQMRMPGQPDWKSYLEWSGSKK